MEPFEVVIAIRESKWWDRWALAAVHATFWFFGMAFFHLFSPRSWNGGLGWVTYLLFLACCSAFFGLAMAFARPLRRWESRLFVDDEEITAISETVDSKKKMTHGLTIRRGTVQAVFNIRPRLLTPGGFGFSDKRGRFPRLRGFIFVTHGTPKYELIKTIVLGWRAETLD